MNGAGQINVFLNKKNWNMFQNYAFRWICLVFFVIL